MSINMNIGIIFGYVFNDTDFEWHQLQHISKKHINDMVIHCVYDTFDKNNFICDTIEEHKIKFYYKFDTNEKIISIMAIQVRDIISQLEE